MRRRGDSRGINSLKSEVLLLKAIFRPGQPAQSLEKAGGTCSRTFIFLVSKSDIVSHVLAETEKELDHPKGIARKAKHIQFEGVKN